MTNQNVVLIVDDKPENLNIVVHELEKYNYKIFIAITGEDALEQLKKINPDIILLDVLMPGLNGFETCLRIKENPKTKDIPVIFLTALSDISNKIKGFEVGGVDFITKPIHREELLARVNIHVKLRNMQKELLHIEKMKSLSVLAGGIAQDFNNVLFIALGNIEMLKNKCLEPQFLNAAESAILKAAELSSKLINFAKGGVPFMKINNLKKLVENTCNALVTSYKDINFNIQSSNDLYPVAFDENLIKRVLIELIKNAVQAMNNIGKIDINLKNDIVDINSKDIVEKYNYGKYVVISIKDYGYGISADNISMIFEPYYSTKSQGFQNGMGLGLASSYSIIQKHNGYIKVESTPGYGSTFHIYFPVNEQYDENKIIEEAKQDDNEYMKKRILFMDDDKMVRRMTKSMIEYLGFKITTAKDGRDAVHLYKESLKEKKPYDLLILDLIVKNGMGGKEAMEKIFEMDKNVKAYISTGYHNDPAINNYKEYGFINVLMKPYTLNELRETLSTI